MSQTQFFLRTEVIAYKDGDEPVRYVLDENNLQHLEMLFKLLSIHDDTKDNDVNESDVMEFLQNFASKINQQKIILVA